MKDQDISMWLVELILDNRNSIAMSVNFTEEFPNEVPTIYIEMVNFVSSL